MVFGNHGLPELIQPLASREPAGGNNHRQEAWLKRFRLLDEQVIDRCRARAITAIAQLIRRISDNNVKLHIVSKYLGKPSRDVVGVDEGIGVVFQPLRPIKNRLPCSTVTAFSILPVMFRALKPNITGIVGEPLGDGMCALGVSGAIDAPPRQQAGEVGDADAENLLGENVIDPLFKIGNLLRQSFGEAAGDLARKHPRLRKKVIA